MSSRPFDGLTIQSDGYTHFAAFLLVIDFMIVQTHFWSMLKHDPSVAENTAVKVLSGFAIASEFLLLTPLFLMSKIDASSAFVILLVVIGFSLVQLFCFAISLIKTWMIHGKMHSEGRIQSYDTYLKVATALIVIGSLASFLGGTRWPHQVHWILHLSPCPELLASKQWTSCHQENVLGSNCFNLLSIYHCMRPGWNDCQCWYAIPRRYSYLRQFYTCSNQ